MHTTQTSAAADPGTPPLPARGWTPERKACFLDSLAAKGNVRLACARVGLSAEAAYRLRRRDALFARGWAAALVLAQEKNEEVLADRAIDGIEEEVWFRGELVGTRRRYDTRLFLAHLARIDRQIDRQVEDGSGGEDAARFDELLALITGVDAPAEIGRWGDPLPLDREMAGQRAALVAEAALREELQERPLPDENEDGSLVEEEDFDRICDDAAEDARADTEALWDGWQAQAFDIVDRAAGQPETPPAPGLPGNPLPGNQLSANPLPAMASAPGFVSKPDFSLRTMSTVSTSALAQAGPVRHFTPPPVPRRPQRR